MNTLPSPAAISERPQTGLFASMIAAPAQPPGIAKRAGWVIVPRALVTLGAWPLRDMLDAANTAMLYLLVVALVALRAGRVAALVAAFASTALLDFFFIHPRFTFTVGDVQHMVTLAVML